MKCFEDLILHDLSYKVQYIEFPWWVPGIRGRKRVFRPTHYWVPSFLPSHLMRKSTRTFWPTQENQKRKEKFEFQNLGWNSVLLVFNIFKLTQSLYSPTMKLWDISLINLLIWFFSWTSLNENFQIANILFLFFPIFFRKELFREMEEQNLFYFGTHLNMSQESHMHTLIESASLAVPNLADGFFTAEPPGKPISYPWWSFDNLSWKVSGLFSLSFCFFKIHGKLIFPLIIKPSIIW